MATFVEAEIVEVIEESAGLVLVRVEAGESLFEAAGFPSMLGPLHLGDRIVVNTTGIDLELGTGGVGFVLWNLDGAGPQDRGPGHIVKLRYTPWQMNVAAAEAPESPHHEALAGASELGGMPVVACGLHSQIAGVAAGIKARAPEARVGYLMTDGGALPLAWSRLVSGMRAAGLVDSTCTSGHAFGGDLEAVNVFSGLAALRHASAVDVVVVSLGPGVVGTATALGFSGIEQGQVLDAAFALQGRGYACLRISFADARARHRGVSHHTLTALAVAARERATAVLPRLGAQEMDLVRRQLAALGERHDLIEEDGHPGLDLLLDSGVEVTTMGRSISEAPEGFLAAAAGSAAARALPP
ncbi:MAG TPA: DUF3866 family protein [Actinomycetota bacterium]|nr:DUF3866 family protein [Actinomycetota bacterium]